MYNNPMTFSHSFPPTLPCLFPPPGPEGETLDRLTVLGVRLSENVLVPKHLLHLGEEVLLFIVVVRLHKLVPGEGVAHEAGLVALLNVRGLQVY